MNPDVKKRIFTSLILVGVLVLLTIIPVSWGNVSKGNTNNITSSPLLDGLAEATAKLPPNEDTDGDGVPNWEENLRGTDPTKKDSPKTTGSTTVPLDKETLALLNDPNNLTVELAKNNLTVISYLANNKDTPTSDFGSISNGVLSQTASAFTFTKHTLSEIKVVASPTNKDIKNFGDTLATTTTTFLIKYLNTSDIDDLQTITKGDPVSAQKAKKHLDTKVHDLDVLISKVLSLPLAADGAVTQLTFVNAVAEYRDILASFSNVKTDPLRASLALASYKESLQSILTLYKGYEVYFKHHNIIFLPKDYGYVFTAGIGN